MRHLFINVFSSKICKSDSGLGALVLKNLNYHRVHTLYIYVYTVIESVFTFVFLPINTTSSFNYVNM
jgi:hypothetical protein